MASVAEIDTQLLALTNERDAAVASYKQRIAALRGQRESAIAAEKVAAMPEPEREALRQALTITPAPAVSAPQANQPGGVN